MSVILKKYNKVKKVNEMANAGAVDTMNKIMLNEDLPGNIAGSQSIGGMPGFMGDIGTTLKDLETRRGRDFAFSVFSLAVVNPYAALATIGGITTFFAVRGILTSVFVRRRRVQRQINKVYKKASGTHAWTKLRFNTGENYFNGDDSDNFSCKTAMKWTGRFTGTPMETVYQTKHYIMHVLKMSNAISRRLFTEHNGAIEYNSSITDSDDEKTNLARRVFSMLNKVMYPRNQMKDIVNSSKKQLEELSKVRYVDGKGTSGISIDDYTKRAANIPKEDEIQYPSKMLFYSMCDKVLANATQLVKSFELKEKKNLDNGYCLAYAALGKLNNLVEYKDFWLRGQCDDTLDEIMGSNEWKDAEKYMGYLTYVLGDTYKVDVASKKIQVGDIFYRQEKINGEPKDVFYAVTNTSGIDTVEVELCNCYYFGIYNSTETVLARNLVDENKGWHHCAVSEITKYEKNKPQRVETNYSVYVINDGGDAHRAYVNVHEVKTSANITSGKNKNLNNIGSVYIFNYLNNFKVYPGGNLVNYTMYNSSEFAFRQPQQFSEKTIDSSTGVKDSVYYSYNDKIALKEADAFLDGDVLNEDSLNEASLEYEENYAESVLDYCAYVKPTFYYLTGDSNKLVKVTNFDISSKEVTYIVLEKDADGNYTEGDNEENSSIENWLNDKAVPAYDYLFTRSTSNDDDDIDDMDINKMSKDMVDPEQIQYPLTYREFCKLYLANKNPLQKFIIDKVFNSAGKNIVDEQSDEWNKLYAKCKINGSGDVVFMVSEETPPSETGYKILKLSKRSHAVQLFHDYLTETGSEGTFISALNDDTYEPIAKVPTMSDLVKQVQQKKINARKSENELADPNVRADAQALMEDTTTGTTIPPVLKNSCLFIKREIDRLAMGWRKAEFDNFRVGQAAIIYDGDEFFKTLESGADGAVHKESGISEESLSEEAKKMLKNDITFTIPSHSMAEGKNPVILYAISQDDKDKTTYKFAVIKNPDNKNVLNISGADIVSQIGKDISVVTMSVNMVGKYKGIIIYPTARPGKNFREGELYALINDGIDKCNEYISDSDKYKYPIFEAYVYSVLANDIKSSNALKVAYVLVDSTDDGGNVMFKNVFSGAQFLIEHNDEFLKSNKIIGPFTDEPEKTITLVEHHRLVEPDEWFKSLDDVKFKEKGEDAFDEDGVVSAKLIEMDETNNSVKYSDKDGNEQTRDYIYMAKHVYKKTEAEPEEEFKFEDAIFVNYDTFTKLKDIEGYSVEEIQSGIPEKYIRAIDGFYEGKLLLLNEDGDNYVLIRICGNKEIAKYKVPKDKLAVFIKTKHKEDENSIIRCNKDNCQSKYPKYFYPFLEKDKKYNIIADGSSNKPTVFTCDEVTDREFKIRSGKTNAIVKPFDDFARDYKYWGLTNGSRGNVDEPRPTPPVPTRKAVQDAGIIINITATDGSSVIIGDNNNVGKFTNYLLNAFKLQIPFIFKDNNVQSKQKALGTAEETKAITDSAYYKFVLGRKLYEDGDESSNNDNTSGDSTQEEATYRIESIDQENKKVILVSTKDSNDKKELSYDEFVMDTELNSEEDNERLKSKLNTNSSDLKPKDGVSVPEQSALDQNISQVVTKFKDDCQKNVANNADKVKGVLVNLAQKFGINNDVSNIQSLDTILYGLINTYAQNKPVFDASIQQNYILTTNESDSVNASVKTSDENTIVVVIDNKEYKIAYGDWFKFNPILVVANTKLPIIGDGRNTIIQNVNAFFNEYSNNNPFAAPEGTQTQTPKQPQSTPQQPQKQAESNADGQPQKGMEQPQTPQQGAATANVTNANASATTIQYSRNIAVSESFVGNNTYCIIGCSEEDQNMLRNVVCAIRNNPTKTGVRCVLKNDTNLGIYKVDGNSVDINYSMNTENGNILMSEYHPVFESAMLIKFDNEGNVVKCTYPKMTKLIKS